MFKRVSFCIQFKLLRDRVLSLAKAVARHKCTTAFHCIVSESILLYLSITAVHGMAVYSEILPILNDISLTFNIYDYLN